MEVPRDDLAEETVIGCCIDLHDSYVSAATRVDRSHFYRPELADIFDVCADLAHLAGSDLATLDRRIAAIAGAARLDPGEVRRLVESRPVQWDLSGAYAKRVVEAAQARKVMQACADIYNCLGAGGPREHLLVEAAEMARRVLESVG